MNWNPFRRRAHECCEVELIATTARIGDTASGMLRYDTTHVEYIGVVVNPDEVEDVYGYALDAARDTLHKALRDGPDPGPAPTTT